MASPRALQPLQELRRLSSGSLKCALVCFILGSRPPCLFRTIYDPFLSQFRGFLPTPTFSHFPLSAVSVASLKAFGVSPCGIAIKSSHGH